jgi:hypothetical protein
MLQIFYILKYSILTNVAGDDSHDNMAVSKVSAVIPG